MKGRMKVRVGPITKKEQLILNLLTDEELKWYPQVDRTL